MSKYYQGKYRVDTVRAKFWDYSWNGAYFVTIKTYNSERFLGEVIDEKMHHSIMGHVANSCWYEIPKHFPFVQLGVHQVMPDHVHGIIIIKKPISTEVKVDDGGLLESQKIATSQPPASTRKSKNKFGPQSNNLGSILRGYKAGVTTSIRTVFPNFKWQSKYHDTIIRDEKSFQRITAYILDNPKRWSEKERKNGGKSIK